MVPADAFIATQDPLLLPNRAELEITGPDFHILGLMPNERNRFGRFWDSEFRLPAHIC